DNEAYVIELNLRASRTFPFISKVTGVNFMKLFVDALFKKDIPEVKIPAPTFVAVKVPQFSFQRLAGADPVLHVEMASTGEVACFGETLEEAYLKGLLSVGGKIPTKGIFVSVGGNEKKEKFFESMQLLSKLNIPLFATEKTAAYYSAQGIKIQGLFKIYEKKSPNILDYFQKNNIDLAINIAEKGTKKEVSDDYEIRRQAVDNNIPLFTKLRNARLFVKSLTSFNVADLPIKPWSQYR
ncbi:MAG: carbamoyl phosphate synthase large subunit, partial [Candidatus Levyibacteriota bacterium]